MAITYTWEISSLKTKDVSPNKVAAVVQVYWKKIGTDENGVTGRFSGATPFTVDPTDDSGPFIEFSLLTEEDVIGWVQTVVVDEYEKHVNDKILQEIENKNTPVKDETLPWALEANSAPVPLD